MDADDRRGTRRFVDRWAVAGPAALGQFEGRRPDALAFAVTYGVVLVRSSRGVPIDLAVGSSDFEVATLVRSSDWELEPGQVICTCSAEDLIVHKLVAGRPRDISNVESIVARQGCRLDTGYLSTALSAFEEVVPERELAATWGNIARRFRRASMDERGRTRER